MTYKIEDCNYIATNDLEFKNVRQIFLFNRLDKTNTFVGFYDEEGDYYIIPLSDITYFCKVKEGDKE